MVSAAAENNLISGYPDGTFRPQKSITRGEAAVILLNAVGTPVSRPGTTTLGDVWGNVTITSSGAVSYTHLTPLPVILVSSLNLKVFDALAAGAVDFVRKPDGTESKQSFLDSLAQKIVVASCAKVRRRAAVSPAAPSLSSVSPAGVGGRSDLDRTIIGLGASTGGTEATLEAVSYTHLIGSPEGRCRSTFMFSSRG